MGESSRHARSRGFCPRAARNASLEGSLCRLLLECRQTFFVVSVVGATNARVKDEDQEYAQVSKMLGNGRLEATCFDGTSRLCHIRGKFRKRVWINAGDIVLLGLREYQDGKADVIHRYSPEEARTLKAYGEIPEVREDVRVSIVLTWMKTTACYYWRLC